jgi:putative flippase GtrA
MSAADMSEIARFGAVGIVATAIYAILATVLTKWDWIGLKPVTASLAAYAAAAIFSYLAHKSVTFLSSGAHRLEGPRFLALTATGIAIAYAAPVVLTDIFDLEPVFAILATCVLVPALNFVVMDRWVFAGRGPRQ